MTKSLCLRLAAMPWAELLDRFDSASRVGRPGGADHEQLREYFGAEELEALLGLRARALAAERRNGRERPVVVFLPGIMGSNLVAVRRGIDEDLVWIDYLGLAAGQMELLRLTPDGRREAETAVRVRCISVDKRAYAGLVVALSGHWDVQPFAFDWRKDLDLAAERLQAYLDDSAGTLTGTVTPKQR